MNFKRTLHYIKSDFELESMVGEGVMSYCPRSFASPAAAGWGLWMTLNETGMSTCFLHEGEK